MVCKNVTLAMDYKLYWKGNGITSVTLTRTVGNLTLNTDGKGAPTKPPHAWTGPHVPCVTNISYLPVQCF